MTDKGFVDQLVRWVRASHGKSGAPDLSAYAVLREAAPPAAVAAKLAAEILSDDCLWRGERASKAPLGALRTLAGLGGPHDSHGQTLNLVVTVLRNGDLPGPRARLSRLLASSKIFVAPVLGERLGVSAVVERAHDEDVRLNYVKKLASEIEAGDEADVARGILDLREAEVRSFLEELVASRKSSSVAKLARALSRAGRPSLGADALLAGNGGEVPAAFMRLQAALMGSVGRFGGAVAPAKDASPTTAAAAALGDFIRARLRLLHLTRPTQIAQEVRALRRTVGRLPSEMQDQLLLGLLRVAHRENLDGEIATLLDLLTSGEVRETAIALLQLKSHPGPVAVNADAARTVGQPYPRFRSQTVAESAARALDRSDPTHLLQRGLSLLAAGEEPAARRSFAQIKRGFRLEGERVRWPITSDDGEPWPPAIRSPAGSSAVTPSLKEPVRICVAVPSLNQGRYVEATLQSLFAQDYPQLEIRVVDGGSTDETLTILERYKDHITAIDVVEGMSQVDAINHALASSDADVFSWLNTDDLLMPNALARVAESFHQSDAVLAIGDAMLFDVDRVSYYTSGQFMAERFSVNELQDVFSLWLRGDFICQPEVFIAKTLWRQLKGLSPALEYCMDYDLWLRAAALQPIVRAIPGPLAAFRKHKDQKTGNQFATFRELVQVAQAVPDSPRAPAARRRFPTTIKKVGLRLWGDYYPSALSAARELQHAFVSRNGTSVEVLGPGPFRAPGPEVDLTINLFGPDAAGVHEAEFVRSLATGPSFQVGWFWSCHLDFVNKHLLSRHCDVSIPGLADTGFYLSNKLPGGLSVGECALNLVNRHPVIESGRHEVLFLVERDQAATGKLPLLWRDGLGGLDRVSTFGDLAYLSGGDDGVLRVLLADFGHVALASERFASWQHHELLRLGASVLFYSKGMVLGEQHGPVDRTGTGRSSRRDLSVATERATFGSPRLLADAIEEILASLG